jgi:hypothetical protein
MCVCAPRMSLFFSGRASCTRSGWREPAVARGRAQSGNSDCICNCVTEPRRADARRSCKRAFVYRTSRSFTGKCPHRRTTKSGGRKPPVVTINANATAIRTHTVGGVPNNRARVCANMFPTPTAGSRPPLLVAYTAAAADRRFRFARTLRYPRRADARRSCECAFVHRECRYFSVDGRHAPGAAGVSQPWL